MEEDKTLIPLKRSVVEGHTMFYCPYIPLQVTNMMKTWEFNEASRTYYVYKEEIIKWIEHHPGYMWNKISATFAPKDTTLSYTEYKLSDELVTWMKLTWQ